jgi:rubrerythrin
MEFKDSKTYQNLQAALNRELTSSAKYRIYAKKARKDGFWQIGDLFDETARNEQEHGEVLMKLLHGGALLSTSDNLRDAISRENYEWNTMYQQFADVARQEGYSEIAEKFEDIARIENNHDGRFEALVWNIEANRAFCRENEAAWVCNICGNLVWDRCAPDPCPVCGCSQGHYQMYCDPF